jgi:hypothetical protein
VKYLIVFAVWLSIGCFGLLAQPTDSLQSKADSPAVKPEAVAPVVQQKTDSLQPKAEAAPAVAKPAEAALDVPPEAKAAALKLEADSLKVRYVFEMPPKFSIFNSIEVPVANKISLGDYRQEFVELFEKDSPAYHMMRRAEGIQIGSDFLLAAPAGLLLLTGSISYFGFLPDMDDKKINKMITAGAVLAVADMIASYFSFRELQQAADIKNSKK